MMLRCRSKQPGEQGFHTVSGDKDERPYLSAGPGRVWDQRRCRWRMMYGMLQRKTLFYPLRVIVAIVRGCSDSSPGPQCDLDADPRADSLLGKLQ